MNTEQTNKKVITHDVVTHFGNPYRAGLTPCSVCSEEEGLRVIWHRIREELISKMGVCPDLEQCTLEQINTMLQAKLGPKYWAKIEPRLLPEEIKPAFRY